MTTTMTTTRGNIDPIDGTGYVILSAGRLEVEVWIKHALGTPKVLTSGVNWSAYGTQTPDVARRYASLIEEAARLAELLLAEANRKQIAAAHN